MQFILTGFSQESSFRVFSFEGIAADRTRTPFTVKADVALARRYGIQLQELPLLCRELLERREAGVDEHVLTYTEAEMCTQAQANTAARELAAQKKKAPRKPPTENVGMAWRVPPR